MWSFVDGAAKADRAAVPDGSHAPSPAHGVPVGRLGIARGRISFVRGARLREKVGHDEDRARQYPEHDRLSELLTATIEVASPKTHRSPNVQRCNKYCHRNNDTAHRHLALAAGSPSPVPGQVEYSANVLASVPRWTTTASSSTA